MHVFLLSKGYTSEGAEDFINTVAANLLARDDFGQEGATALFTTTIKLSAGSRKGRIKWGHDNQTKNSPSTFEVSSPYTPEIELMRKQDMSRFIAGINKLNGVQKNFILKRFNGIPLKGNVSHSITYGSSVLKRTLELNLPYWDAPFAYPVIKEEV